MGKDSAVVRAMRSQTQFLSGDGLQESMQLTVLNTTAQTQTWQTETLREDEGRIHVEWFKTCTCTTLHACKRAGAWERGYCDVACTNEVGLLLAKKHAGFLQYSLGTRPPTYEGEGDIPFGYGSLVQVHVPRGGLTSWREGLTSWHCKTTN